MGSVGNEDRRLALDAGGGRPLPAFRKLEARFWVGRGRPVPELDPLEPQALHREVEADVDGDVAAEQKVHDNH